MMKYFQKRKKLIPLGIFIGLYLLVLVPLIVFNLQQRQDPRGKANTPATCGNVKTDVVLIIDRSGSMTGDKLPSAKTAAKRFIDVLANSGIDNQVGLVSFSTTATTDSQLTNNYAAVKSKVDTLSANGNTCQECAVKAAHTQIATYGRPGVKKVVVMLTDGQANWIEGATRQVDTTTAEGKALAAVQNSFQTQKTIFFTIGLGEKDATGNTRFFGPEFLKKVATTTGGKHYFPAPEELESVYQDISLLIGKGLVGGYFFEDLNTNGTYETNEPLLPGWKANLTSANTNRSAVSDTNGVYTMTGLCDGTYTLKPEIQTGWKQTMPPSAEGYQVTITNANSFTDKHFGVSKAGRCEDKVDNDNNGFIDDKDSTCHTDGNPTNPNSYDKNKDGERGGNTCADSKDNNGNGLIDGADPVCHPGGDITKPWDPNLPEVGADLIITSMQITLDGTDPNFICATGLGLKVTIKNQGYGAVTGSFVLKVNTTNKTISGGLAAGASTSVWIPGVTAGGTSYALVDANEQITESDETNNEKTQVLPMPTLPYICAPTSTPTPTPYPTMGLTSFQLTVFHHGIGNSGDNSNPASSLSNKNPLHKTVNVDLQLFNTSNKMMGEGTGKVTYNEKDGNYVGTITITPNTFPSGKYLLKVKTDKHLRKLMSGVQTINAGQHNTNLQSVTLVAGDIDNNNALNILDYNTLLECYSDLAAAANCSKPGKKESADINDDGPVNQIDYNLFLREIATQPGE